MEYKFDKIYLNDKALDFVVKKLKSQGVIGINIANLISNSKVGIWGFFSKGILEKDLIEFEFGGKFKHRPLKEISEVVKESLEKDSHNCWILIDNNGNTKYSPKENAIEDITTVFFYKDTVLHLLTKNPMSEENIQKTFKLGGAYPFIGFATKMEESIEERILNNKVEEKDMEYLVKNISYIFIGAYDEEGYLVVEFQ